MSDALPVHADGVNRYSLKRSIGGATLLRSNATSADAVHVSPTALLPVAERLMTLAIQRDKGTATDAMVRLMRVFDR